MTEPVPASPVNPARSRGRRGGRPPRLEGAGRPPRLESAVAWAVGLLPPAALFGSWAGVGPVFAYRVLVIALVAMALVTGRRSRAGLAVLVLAVLWLGIGAVDAATGAPGRSLGELAAVALGLAGMWAVIRLRRFQMVGPLARGWAVGVLVSTPVAVWEVATSRHLSTYLNGAWMGHPNVYRAPATWLTNPNLYAVLMAVAVPLLAVRSRRETGVWRWVMVVAAVMAAVLLVATSGRSAMAALAVAVAVRLLADRRGRWWLVGAAAAMALIVVTHWAAVSLAVRRVVGVIAHHSNEGPSSLSVRAALVAVGLWLVGSHPLAGVGPGGYPAVVRAGGLAWRTDGKVNPHAGVLEIASQYGLVVTAAILALCIWAVVAAVRSRGASAGRWWVVGYIAALPVLSFANSTYLVQSVTQLGWLLAAALACSVATTRDVAP